MALAAPVTLSANTAYYLASQETSGGDQWCNYTTVLTTTSAAVVNIAIKGTDGLTYGGVGTTKNSYGPVSFKY